MPDALTYRLRPYQKDLIQTIFDRWRYHRRVMAQLPTGGGKTIVFSTIAHAFIRRGGSVLILAHREELIAQAASKVADITRSPIGTIKAGHRPDSTLAVQVASVQSLVNRLAQYKKFDLIIIDEAHHATASTYRTILEAYPQAYQLGVTATPIRLDGSGFQDCFDDFVLGPTVAELIDAGYLAPFRLFAALHPMATQGVKIRSGDFSASEVAAVNDGVALSGNLIQSYRQYAQGKQCVVFAINVSHSIAIADRYNQAGIPAYHLDGNTPDQERKTVMERFKQGEIKVLSNCGLFEEGLDIPALEVVQIAKPTQSLTRWLQMVGRALRSAEGKSHAIIIDHTPNWEIHGLPTRPRLWSLEGVKEALDVPPLVRTVTGEVRAEKPELIILEQAHLALREIESSLDQEWMAAYHDLLARQTARGHQPQWIYHRLTELKPPLKVWEQYARDRGYSSQWAWQQHQQQQPVTVAS